MPFSSHPCLPCRERSCGQQGPFAPGALPPLTATTVPSATLSPSSPFPGGSPVIGPSILRGFLPGRVGLLQLRDTSLPPCHRWYPAGMVQTHSPVLSAHAVFAHGPRARLPGFSRIEATCAFTFVTAWWLARHPEDGFTTSFRRLVSLPPVVVASRLLVLTMVGSSSHGMYPPFLDARTVLEDFPHTALRPRSRNRYRLEYRTDPWSNMQTRPSSLCRYSLV